MMAISSSSSCLQKTETSGIKKKKASLPPLYAQASNPLSVPASIMITLTSPWLTVSPSCSWTLPSPGCPGSAPSAPPVGQSTTWRHMTFGSCTSRQCWLRSKAAHREEIMKQTWRVTWRDVPRWPRWFSRVFCLLIWSFCRRKKKERQAGKCGRDQKM